ncbi:MAG: hypothetical protein JNM70_12905, partial [Anaerolineae bacterium]|nr:hypothetical protein [Anaerolineae bacterium]
MGLNDIHGVLFNMHILYSLALGIWAGFMALRGQSISGNYWGAVATGAILAGVVLLVAGVPLALSQLLSLGWVWSLIVLVLAALVGAQVVAMRLLQSMR